MGTGACDAVGLPKASGSCAGLERQSRRGADRLSVALSIKDTVRPLEVQRWVSSPWRCIPGHKAPIFDARGSTALLTCPGVRAAGIWGLCGRGAVPDCQLHHLTHPSFRDSSFCWRDGWNYLQSPAGLGCLRALPPHLPLGISEPVGPFCNPREDLPPARAAPALREQLVQLPPFFLVQE